MADIYKHQLADPSTTTTAPDTIKETTYPADDVGQQVDVTTKG